MHQPLRLRVCRDAVDELHVHSVPDHTFPVEAKPNQDVPVHGGCAGSGRRRAAQLEPHGGHHPSAAVTGDLRVGVLAHGLGGSTDLPIPCAYAVIGAAWALTFTFAVVAFAVVAFAWRRPRFDPAKPGRPLPMWITRTVDAPAVRRAVAAVALLFAPRWRRPGCMVRRTAGTHCRACSTGCSGWD